jgi:VWFA-related protein
MKRVLQLVVLVFWVGSISGQEQVIRTEATVVLAPTLIKDAKGKLVYGLRAEDFAIEDDGIAQKVQLDEIVDTQPVSLVVVVQRGGSAFNEFARMQGLGSMLGPLIDQGKTEIAIVEFDSHVNLARDFTTDENVIRTELRRLRPGDGGAAILDALNYGVTLLNDKPKDRQRVLLLISETRDHGSRMTLPNVVTQISNSNLVIYTLAFSPALSQVLDDVRGKNQATSNNADLLAPILMAAQGMRKNIPKAIAAMTGGEYELFKSAKGFETRMSDFDNHVYNRYLLSFEPNDPHPGLHQIRVTVKRPTHAMVLARNSYWVSPPRSSSH